MITDYVQMYSQCRVSPWTDDDMYMMLHKIVKKDNQVLSKMLEFDQEASSSLALEQLIKHTSRITV